MPENILIPAVYLALVNLVSFFLMWSDKRRAVKGTWRIRERTLLLFDFLGGSLLGLAAMLLLRHKTRSLKFRILVPLFLLCNILLTLCILYLTKGSL